MLPVELVQEIIVALTTQCNNLQFGYEKDILNALCQLCLVNRVLFNITAPHLYSSIIISSHHDLQAFLRSSPFLRCHVRALWLRYFPHMFPFIVDLLRDLSPHLQRLALDIPGNELDTSIPAREALQSCTSLRGFARSGYSPMQLLQPSPFWSNWIALRHLVLDGSLIDDKFINAIAQLPHLTHLALIEPRWRYSDDGTEVTAFLQLLKAGQNLQHVLLIYCKASEIYLNSLRRLRAAIKPQGLRDSLNVDYFLIREKVPAPMNHIRAHIGAGTLWDMDSISLLEPLAGWS